MYCLIKCEQDDTDKQLKTHNVFDELKRLKLISKENAVKSEIIESD